MMSPAMKAVMERTIVFSIAAIYIVQQFTQLNMLTPLLGCLVFIALAILMPKLKGMTLWLTISFIVVGASLLLVQRADVSLWFDAASMNVTIVTLFLFAPLFGIPVRIPDYVDRLKQFFESNLRSRAGLFAGTQLLTQIMGVFINVGAIPIVYHMIFVKPRPGLSLLLANALNRGFAGAILWSPYFAAMAIVTSGLKLSWSSVLPFVIGLAILSLLVSGIVDFKNLQQGKIEPPQHEPIFNKEKANFPVGLGLYLAAAIIVILLLEQMLDLPMVILICIAAVGFPLIWCIFKREMPAYRDGLNNHVRVTFPALQKEITLFLAAGFFSGSIGATGFGSAVPALLGHVPLPISVTFSIFTVLMIAGTSLIGLHPIVPVTILVGNIDPLSMEVSPVYFAVLLLGGWALSNPISPSSAVNNLLAGLLKKTVFEIARPNYKFAGCMAIVLLVYMYLLG